MKTNLKALSVLAALSATFASSQAAIITVANYHLGETGSVVGFNNRPDDALSTDEFVSSVANTTAVVTSVSNPGSTEALTFGGDTTGYYTISGNGFFGNNTVTDNFGIQLWLRPTAVGPNATQPTNTFFTTDGDSLSIALSFGITGDTTSSNWTVGIQGSTITGSAVAYDTWTSFGVIRNQGVTSLYINGALSGTPVTTAAPSFEASQVHLGVTPGNGSRYFGMMDELNVFTFDPLTDNPLDGLAMVPEPSTWALLAGSLTVMTIFRRRRAA